MLFSLVPFVALVVSIVDLVLPATRRERFLDWLFAEFPGTELEESVDQALVGSGATAPAVGLISLALLLWGASGMMASLRHAFTAIWDVERAPFVRGKLRDVALVGFAGALLVAAFALSVVAQLVVETGTDVADALGLDSLGDALSVLGELATSLLAAWAALVVVYRFVPAGRPVPLALVWPSALVAAIAFQLAVAGFAVYAARLADFNTAYGSLGTLFAFLLLVYVLAIVVLVGAETVAARSSAAGKAAGSAGV